MEGVGRAVILGGGLSRLEFQVVYASRRHLGAGVPSSAPLLADGLAGRETPPMSLSRSGGCGGGPCSPRQTKGLELSPGSSGGGGTVVLSQPWVGSVPA